MTTQEIIDYYANLLILQYLGKPKAYATIQTSVEPFIMDQLPVAVQDAYDIQTAVGVQLDVIGKYVGVSRRGFGFHGPVTLTDADYRVLITLVIAQNNSGSSLAQIQSLVAGAFPGQIFIFDNQLMDLTYVILDGLGTSSLLQMIATGNFLPVPMAVGSSVTIVMEGHDPFFGFRTYEAPDPTVSPFNTYSSYSLTAPWLSYSGVNDI